MIIPCELATCNFHPNLTGLLTEGQIWDLVIIWEGTLQKNPWGLNRDIDESIGAFFEIYTNSIRLTFQPCTPIIWHPNLVIKFNNSSNTQIINNAIRKWHWMKSKVALYDKYHRCSSRFSSKQDSHRDCKARVTVGKICCPI